MHKKVNLKEFIKKANKKHEYKYDYSKSIYVNSSTYMTIICKHESHGYFEFQKTPETHLIKTGGGCPKCSKCYIPTTEEVISKFIEVHGNRYDYTNVVYKNAKTKVSIICKIHGEFLQHPLQHKMGQGCKKCASISNKPRLIDNDVFIERLRKIHGDRYDFSKTKYIGLRKEITITCKLHGDFTTKASIPLNKFGCKICAKKSQSLNSSVKYDRFIDKCSKFNYNKYDYSLINEIGFSLKNNVSIICPKHGVFDQSANRHFFGQGCPKCKNSRGELVISMYLEENNIKYFRQYNFEDCINPKTRRKLKFDFYLPNQNICIEFDGGQHFTAVKYYGGEDAFKIRKYLDGLKNKYCKLKSIKLIRIPYTNKNIEKILKKNIK